MYWVLLVLHVLASLVLIGVVLLQTGKRADLAGAFGGGGSQTAFGPRGATNFLSRATTISAIVFMVTSLSLSIMSSGPGTGGGTVLDEVPPAAPSAPVTPPSSNAPQAPSDSAPTTPPPAPTPEQNQQPSGK